MGAVPGRSTGSLGRMNALRWLAIIPSGIGAWGLAYIIALGIGVAADALFPSERVAHAYFDQIATLGVALAATFVVAACTLVAPSHRRRVAWGSFALGVFTPVAIASQRVEPELFGAIIAGGVTAAVLSHKFRHDGLTTRLSGP